VGAPPGYIGYDNAGQLTEFVRRRPYSLILLDEIEKAHSEVHDLLLQILEDGCLTDAKGRMTDFKHTIIIMTSNLGTTYLRPGKMNFARHTPDTLLQDMRDRCNTEVKGFFRPELYNRFDEIVYFHPLEREHLHAIVTLFIADTASRLGQQKIELQVTDAARNLLVERGYDPTMGARPLRRTVQRLLDDLLAEAILFGKLNPHNLARVDVAGNQLVLVAYEAESIAPVVANSKKQRH
jgi:ATP-dependent Clp protease ATP-binding subunit ClpC